MGQAPFENFDFFVKVKGPLGQSIFFSHFFFFLKIISSGSDQVRFPGQTGSNQVDRTNRSDWDMEDDIIHDVIALGAYVNAWRVNVSEGSCQRV